MFFKKKTSEDLAEELREAKKTRLRESGRANLQKLINEEKAKTREARGQSGFSKFTGGVKKVIDHVELRSPEERKDIQKRMKNHRLF